LSDNFSKIESICAGGGRRYQPVSPEFFSEKVACTPDGRERGSAMLLQIVVNGRSGEIVA
jgi:hypothetical protein